VRRIFSALPARAYFLRTFATIFVPALQPESGGLLTPADGQYSIFTGMTGQESGLAVSRLILPLAGIPAPASPGGSRSKFPPSERAVAVVQRGVLARVRFDQCLRLRAQLAVPELSGSMLVSDNHDGTGGGAVLRHARASKSQTVHTVAEGERR
jgi:hypothetical protein